MRQLRGVVFPWRSDGACPGQELQYALWGDVVAPRQGVAIDESSGGPGLSADNRVEVAVGRAPGRWPRP